MGTRALYCIARDRLHAACIFDQIRAGTLPDLYATPEAVNKAWLMYNDVQRGTYRVYAQEVVDESALAVVGKGIAWVVAVGLTIFALIAWSA